MSFQFLSYFRLCELSLRGEINYNVLTLKRGRCVPHAHCNMDQALLPFVVIQGTTHTNDDGKDAQTTAPSDTVRKQQCAMSIACNVDEGDDRDRHIFLMCKGNSNGRCTVIGNSLE